VKRLGRKTVPVPPGDRAFLRDFLSVLVSTRDSASPLATHDPTERQGLNLAVNQIIDQAYSHTSINHTHFPGDYP